LVAVLPLAAAAFLAWIIVKSVADFTQTENLTLLGVIASGVVMLVIAERKRSPYFQLSRAQYSEDA
jgi:hypothetical protein